MIRRSPILLALSCLAAMPAAAAPEPGLVLPFAAPVVDVLLNGRPARLRVAFDAPGVVMLDPAAARRLALPATGPATVMVGPVPLSGQSGAAVLTLGAARRVVRLAWVGRPPDGAGAGVDGIVSPALLPVASLRLGMADAGDHARSRRTETGADGLCLPLRLRGQRIELRLAPDRPATLATAAAGRVLAEGLGGRVGSAVPTTVAWSVARPVAPLVLDRPLRIGPLSVMQVGVRVGDYGGGTAPRAADPDEIVVTAPGQRARYRLTLGADVLRHCTAIVWRAAGRRVTLDCGMG